MNYINELREGEFISEVYFCKSKTDGTAKTGKTYYSLVLQDKTGTIDGKIWDLSNAIAHFEPMDYIKIDGQVTAFKGTLQLNIKKVRKANEGEYDPGEYMPYTKKNIDEMYRELVDIINSISNKYLKKLLESFFIEDTEFAARFKNHSAAKSIHHGFVGGLLEHTLSVAKLCDFLATRYPVIKRDLLVTAAIFHDIAKVDELSTFPENDYTDEGQLIGHIVMGAMMITERIAAIDGFPVTLANELKHCVLSHHGELEFGSPKKPALIEALALAHADNLDAKLQTFTEVLESNNGKTEWLGYNKMFESNVRATEGKSGE